MGCTITFCTFCGPLYAIFRSLFFGLQLKLYHKRVRNARNKTSTGVLSKWRQNLVPI
jgi:hypothetical protein